MNSGIECARTECSTHIARLPDGSATLFARQSSGTAPVEVFIVGPRSRALFKTISPVTAHSIQVRAGYARRAFGIPASELLNRIVDARTVWGAFGSRLEDDLAHADPIRRPAILASALARRFRTTPEPASAQVARRALDLIEASSDGCRVDDLADHLGITARHLRRVFLDAVGVTPKRVARMVRIGRVMEKICKTETWASIAAEHGYYDQSHLIAEFQSLLGMTPREYESLQSMVRLHAGTDRALALHLEHRTR